MTYGGTTYGGSPLGEDLASGSRTASLQAAGAGVAAIARETPTSFRLPQSPGSDAPPVVVAPESLTTDHETLSLSILVTTEGRETLLDYYTTAGDVVREATAYGAFRRLLRDGRDPVTIEPPADLSPPLNSRAVVPLAADSSEPSPGRYRLTLELGLVEPRPRDPIGSGGATETIASTTVDVGGGATETVTLSGDGPTEFGDYTATVSAEGDSESVVVSVSDAPITFSFPVGTLGLSERQVGPPARAADRGTGPITLPVRLDAGQAATLLAVGSRVPAAQIRETPDAPNPTVDTLPDAELTATADVPPSLGEDLTGDVILQSWTLDDIRTPRRYPFVGTITVVPTE